MRTFFENTRFISEELHRVEFHETMEQRDRDARRHTLLSYLMQAVSEAETRPGAVQQLDAEKQYTHIFRPGGRWDQIKDKPTSPTPKKNLSAEEVYSLINESGV